MRASLVPLLALALAAPASAQDRVRVSAQLSDAQIRTGETTQLEVSILSGGADIDRWSVPPLPTGLSVVGSSDQTQIEFSVPGGRSVTLTRSYILAPTRPGVYRIPPISVQVGGREYRTASLTLSVVGAPASDDAGAGGNADVTFHARMEPDTVYVGEQATLRAEASFAGDLRMRMSWAPEYVPPNPSGFWIQDLGGGTSVSTRVRGRRVTSEVHRYARAYFPLSPGRYLLPPAQLSYDLRSGLFGQSVPRQIDSDSIPLVVLPLPDAGRPRSFTGAVGDYALDASLEPDSVPAGESAVLRVHVTGKGNIRALPPPRLSGVDGVQFYPPSEEARVDDSGGVVAGTKTFKWMVVPEKPGAIELGSVLYGYFDPDARRYRVLRSAPLVLRSTRGAATAVAATDADAALAPLHDAPQPDPPLAWTLAPWFAALQLLPLLAGLGLLVRTRRRRRERRAPSRRALRRRLDATLAALESRAASDDPAFLAALEREVRGWLARRLADPVFRTAAAAPLEDALLRAGIGPEVARPLQRLLQRIEQARFAPAPASAEERRRLVDGAREALRALDRAAPGSAASRAAAAGALVLLLLAPAGGRALQASAPALPDFGGAVAAYRAGRFESARADFAAYLRAHPDDAEAWYDYGLAAMRTGRRGEAVRAWLRSLRLAPRDADARANLAAADVAPALVRRVVPALPLSRQEALLVASLLWLLGGGLLVLRIARRRGTAGWAVLVTVGLALVVLAAVFLPGRLAPTAVVLTPQAPLRPDPDFHSDPLDRLRDGTVLAVEDRRRGWIRVRTPEGREGWVEAAQAGSP